MATPRVPGVVGPFPSWVRTDEERDAYNRLRRRVLWTMPVGLYAVGSRAGDRRNMMTLSWAMQLSVDPKLVAIGVEDDALTRALISEGRVFSVCTIPRDHREIARRFTKPVDLRVDLEASTINGYPFSEASTGAPILEAAVSFLDCELRDEVAAGTHTLFIGEVVDCGFNSEEDAPVLQIGDTRMSYGG